MTGTHTFPKTLGVSQANFCGLHAVNYNLDFEVEKGKWTCVACMDRKTHNRDQVLKHEKSEGHARSVAIQLRKVEDLIPNALDFTDVEETTPTLQSLLDTLAGVQDETDERDFVRVARSVDDETGSEVLDISALSGSLLGHIDGDQENIHYLGLEEQGSV